MNVRSPSLLASQFGNFALLYDLFCFLQIYICVLQIQSSRKILVLCAALFCAASVAHKHYMVQTQELGAARWDTPEQGQRWLNKFVLPRDAGLPMTCFAAKGGNR
jgi:hypothetical protein